MNTEIADAATLRAWDTYLLMKLRIDDELGRRAALADFIAQRCAAGNDDAETLAVEGLKFLKRSEGEIDSRDDDREVAERGS